MSRPKLIQVVHLLEDVLEPIGIQRSYGGAIAYNFYGPPRFTQDVDLLILVPDSKIPRMLEALAGSGFRDGTPQAGVIDLRAVLADLRSQAHLARFQYQGVPVETFVPWHPFHHEVLRRSPIRELGGRQIRIHAPEDLIVFKKIFDRPKDLQDIRAMLLANKGQFDAERIRRDARGLLTDASWKELDELLRQCA
jgi:hypothetical protein